MMYKFYENPEGWIWGFIIQPKKKKHKFFQWRHLCHQNGDMHCKPFFICSSFFSIWPSIHLSLGQPNQVLRGVSSWETSKAGLQIDSTHSCTIYIMALICHYIRTETFCICNSKESIWSISIFNTFCFCSKNNEFDSMLQQEEKEKSLVLD